MGVHYLIESPLKEEYVPGRLWVVMPKEITYFQKDVCCIYKLCFNDHYYIGKSSDLVFRQYAHANKFRYRTDPNDVKFYGKPKKIFDYLIKHPELNYIYCKILRYCDVHELQKFEQLELDKSINDPLCLNSKFISTLMQTEKKIGIMD